MRTKIVIVSIIWLITIFAGGSIFPGCQKKPSSNDVLGVFKTVSLLAVDPADNNNVFVGINDLGLFRSTKNGDEWQATGLTSGTPSEVAFDPNQKTIFYLAGSFSSRAKIYKSIDGGVNFGELFFDVKTETTVTSLKVDKQAPQKITALLSSGVLMMSEDYGRNWQIKKDWEALPTDAIISPAINLVAFENNLWQSKDQAATWKDITKEINDKLDKKAASKILGLSLDEKTDKVYLFSQNGLFISSDGGENWQETGAINYPDKIKIGNIVVNQLNQEIYLSVNSSFYRSTDNGQSWSIYQINDNNIEAIALDPKNQYQIYLGMVNSK